MLDRFHGPDAEPLPAHTPDIGGPWVDVQGNTFIFDNEAQASSIVDYDNIALIDTGSANNVLYTEQQFNAATGQLVAFTRKETTGFDGYRIIGNGSGSFDWFVDSTMLAHAGDLVVVEDAWYAIRIAVQGPNAQVDVYQLDNPSNGFSYTPPAMLLHIAQTRVGMDNAAVSGSLQRTRFFYVRDNSP